ncbi:MAG: hypothetical protein J5590_02835 [Clostridia bacterium]|nr:hypothetical protein [Clostridia bacterium]
MEVSRKTFLLISVITLITCISCMTSCENITYLRWKSPEQILAGMSLEEKVYQMFFVAPESITPEIGQAVMAGETTKNAMDNHPVGGIIYFEQNIIDKEQIEEMLKNVKSFSKITPFLGVDEEGGRVARLGNNGLVTQYPPMKEIGDTNDTQKAKEIGETLGNELCALGFNVDFAPVADVLFDTESSEIGDRSFGADASLVSQMVSNEVYGLHTGGVSAVLKHFPGHGSVKTNSHEGYAESDKTLEELKNCDFLPFKAGIDAGADFVLISHAAYVNAAGECPASLSKEIISWLKDGMGFDGIVITDSFCMGAIADNYTAEEAAVEAVYAGVDMILMPADLEESANALIGAVKDGRISEERINESVLKILSVKRNRGLI